MSDGKQVTGRIALEGRITIENAEEARATLRKALLERLPILLVNMSGVVYIDTSAIAMLMEASRIARTQGNRVVLEGVHDQPAHLLKVTRLDRLFDIAGEEDHK